MSETPSSTLSMRNTDQHLRLLSKKTEPVISTSWKMAGRTQRSSERQRNCWWACYNPDIISFSFTWKRSSTSRWRRFFPKAVPLQRVTQQGRKQPIKRLQKVFLAPRRNNVHRLRSFGEGGDLFISPIWRKLNPRRKSLRSCVNIRQENSIPVLRKDQWSKAESKPLQLLFPKQVNPRERRNEYPFFISYWLRYLWSDLCHNVISCFDREK